MTQSLGMRATSFGASPVLLGLAVFAALSVTISMQLPTFNGPAPIPVETLPPLEPPRPITRQQEPPPRPLPEDEPTDITFEPPVLPQGPETTGPATFFPPDLGPALITNPRWLRQPRDLESYYPSRALGATSPGRWFWIAWSTSAAL